MDERFGPAAMAIILGDNEALHDLVTADADLITVPSSVSHPTLLQFVACEASNLPDPVGAAKVLVDAGAEKQAPLVAAAGCGSAEIVAFLLDAGAAVDTGSSDDSPVDPATWTPLDEALYWSNHVIATYLVGRGAAIRALSTAAGLGRLEAIAACFDGAGGLTPAAGRIGSPFADTVPEHLAEDPQAILDHAFVMAVNCCQLAAAQDLYERGAQVNARPPGYHWQGTALHAAASQGDRVTAEWLLGIGADPSMRDGMVDSDAAGWAHHHGHPDLATLLAAEP